MTNLQTTLTVVGALTMLGALLSGIAARSMLSLTALFALVGLAVGRAGTGWLTFSAPSTFVKDLAYITLIVILFHDGLEVEGEMLRSASRAPLRKLALAMPLTALIIAAFSHLVVGLTWTQALLLGALLSPTDPILTSTIVTDSRIPRLIRHSLNLESGLNDGLALPAVLVFTAALSTSTRHFVWWHFLIQDIGLGLAFGIAIGWIAALALPRPGAEGPTLGVIAPHQRSLYCVGVALVTYGVTVLSPEGNGFIAVFVCAIVLANRRDDLRLVFQERGAELVELVKLGIFVVFGSLLTIDSLTRGGWASAAVVLVTLLAARPLAVWVSLIGTTLTSSTRLFMGWFGPKGVSTMAFSLLVLESHVQGAHKIFDLTSLVVFCSIIVHGATDTPGARWIARRAAVQDV